MTIVAQISARLHLVGVLLRLFEQLCVWSKHGPAASAPRTSARHLSIGELIMPLAERHLHLHPLRSTTILASTLASRVR
jgi:hypothetical protein